MIHDLIPQCLQESFTDFDIDAAEEDGGEDDFRAYIHRKVKRARELLGNTEFKQKCILRTWLGEDMLQLSQGIFL